MNCRQNIHVKQSVKMLAKRKLPIDRTDAFRIALNNYSMYKLVTYFVNYSDALKIYIFN